MQLMQTKTWQQRHLWQQKVSVSSEASTMQSIIILSHWKEIQHQQQFPRWPHHHHAHRFHQRWEDQPRQAVDKRHGWEENHCVWTYVILQSIITQQVSLLEIFQVSWTMSIIPICPCCQAYACSSLLSHAVISLPNGNGETNNRLIFEREPSGQISTCYLIQLVLL